MQIDGLKIVTGATISFCLSCELIKSIWKLLAWVYY